MTRLLTVRPGRQDVDRLAVLLEPEPDATSAQTEMSADDRVMADLADALRAVPIQAVPTMRAEFRADLRQQVLAAARDGSGTPLLTRIRQSARSLRYSTAAATGASMTAIALSGGGVAVAAEHAQPDDLLYDVKLALEDLRLTLTLDDVARGERAMSYAFERLEEARTAATAGNDQAAAEALRGAAERTEAAGDLLVGSGLVDPVIELAGDLSAQVALIEALRPLLGEAGTEAADALLDTIVATTEAVLEVIDIADWPTPDVPVLPGLPLPQQSTIDTSVPSDTDPPLEGAAPGSSVQSSPIDPDEEPSSPGLLPGVPLPGVPLPGLPLPLPGLPLPGVPPPGPSGGPVPVPQPGSSGGPRPVPEVEEPVEQGLDEVEGVGGDLADGLGTVVDGVGGTTDSVGDGAEDILDGIVDTVPDPVQSLLPEPVADVMDDLPGTVDDVSDVVPGLLEPVPEVLDGVGGVVDGLVGGLLGG